MSNDGQPRVSTSIQGWRRRHWRSVFHPQPDVKACTVLQRNATARPVLQVLVTVHSVGVFGDAESKNSLLFFRINFRELRFAQTMIFAIEEINNNSLLLPNISVGYRVFDTCGLPLPSARAAMALMNGDKRTTNCSTQPSVHAIIGASESSSTIGILQISGIFQIPVVIWLQNLFIYV